MFTHQFTFDDRSRGGTKAAAQPTYDDRSRGGSACGGIKGKGGGNKEGRGIGKHSAPKTQKAQTQANFVSYQAAHPEKLPKEAQKQGFHYSDLKLLGMIFMNATDKNKARVSKISKKKK
jgi:hypothetical protein